MNLKQARGQLRQIVKEVLPEILTQELKSALYAEIKELTISILDTIDKDIKRTMEEINTRSKDAADYLVRNTSHVPMIPLEDPALPTSTSTEVK